MLFGNKRRDSKTWKHLKIYWLLALADLAFMGLLSNQGDGSIELSLIAGLILSMYHLYISVSALNVVTEQANPSFMPLQSKIVVCDIKNDYQLNQSLKQDSSICIHITLIHYKRSILYLSVSVINMYNINTIHFRVS